MVTPTSNTSQLLVNLYLNEFDQFVKHQLKVKHYLRYADDFVLLSPDRDQLIESLSYMGVFLHEQLRLVLHPDKVSIKTLASGVDYLGWVHFPDHRVLRTTTRRRTLKRLEVTDYAPAVVASYSGLLKHGNAFKLRQSILNF
ncbi:MAG: RNA-directed DNA polymerase [Candidatus Vogelbacteria bacterium]|nr:RNA-directed DNA polymerase [Candidatus Vogelbacteria bacterium]